MSFTEKSSAPFVVISVNDPAIDKATLAGKIAVRRYIQERDASVLVYLSGARPAQFHCRPMVSLARTTCEGLEQEVLRNMLAFAACVERVDDLGVEWVARQTPAAWGTLLEQASVDSLAEKIGGKVIEEIGSVCLQRANLTAVQGKAYALPPGYVVVWPSASAPSTPITAAPNSGSSADAE